MSKITSPAITLYSLHEFALNFEALWPEICKKNNLTYQDSLPLYYYLAERSFIANVALFSERARIDTLNKPLSHDVYEDIYLSNADMYRSWHSLTSEALQGWSEQCFKLTILGNVLLISPETPWT